MKKKILVSILIIFICLACQVIYYKTFGVNEKAITNKTESTLVEIKEKEMSSLEDYEARYNSKTYGYTAYILHKVQVYSIPFTILGIIIAAVCDFVIGARHLETKEKGQALMITFITLGIICQVLPLVFTIVVKYGRE